MPAIAALRSFGVRDTSSLGSVAEDRAIHHHAGSEVGSGLRAHEGQDFEGGRTTTSAALGDALGELDDRCGDRRDHLTDQLTTGGQLTLLAHACRAVPPGQGRWLRYRSAPRVRLSFSRSSWRAIFSRMSMVMVGSLCSNTKSAPPVVRGALG